MKVVAVLNPGDHSLDHRFLVEMDRDEIRLVAGIDYVAEKVAVGLVAEPVKLLQMLDRVRSQQKSAEAAAANLRSLASLVDTVLAESRSAITPAPAAGQAEAVTS